MHRNYANHLKVVRLYHPVRFTQTLLSSCGLNCGAAPWNGSLVAPFISGKVGDGVACLVYLILNCDVRYDELSSLAGSMLRFIGCTCDEHDLLLYA